MHCSLRVQLPCCRSSANRSLKRTVISRFESHDLHQSPNQREPNPELVGAVDAVRVIWKRKARTRRRLLFTPRPIYHVQYELHGCRAYTIRSKANSEVKHFILYEYYEKYTYYVTVYEL